MSLTVTYPNTPYSTQFYLQGQSSHCFYGRDGGHGHPDREQPHHGRVQPAGQGRPHWPQTTSPWQVWAEGESLLSPSRYSRHVLFWQLSNIGLGSLKAFSSEDCEINEELVTLGNG